MIGWLIAAGIIGAACCSGGESKTYYIDNRDYGGGIPYRHKTCQHCGHGERTSVYVVGRNRSFVKLKFVCRNCGRVWTKTYRID